MPSRETAAVFALLGVAPEHLPWPTQTQLASAVRAAREHALDDPRRLRLVNIAAAVRAAAHARAVQPKRPARALQHE